MAYFAELINFMLNWNHCIHILFKDGKEAKVQMEPGNL